MDFGDFVVCSLFVIAIATGVHLYKDYKDYKAWKSAPIIIVEATLLNQDYQPSTLKTHCTPVFHGGHNSYCNGQSHYHSGGMSMAVRTTGHDKIYTTIWDCGQYGRCICDDEKVFRKAKSKSKLKIKYLFDEVRIYGIV